MSDVGGASDGGERERAPGQDDEMADDPDRPASGSGASAGLLESEHPNGDYGHGWGDGSNSGSDDDPEAAAAAAAARHPACDVVRRRLAALPVPIAHGGVGSLDEGEGVSGDGPIDVVGPRNAASLFNPRNPRHGLAVAALADGPDGLLHGHASASASGSSAQTQARRLFAVVRPTGDGGHRLDLSVDLPRGWTQCLYLVLPASGASGASDPTTSASSANAAASFDRRLQSGVLAHDHLLLRMLRTMETLYAPAALANSTWPGVVRTELVGSLHRFMATLTEEAHATAGRTVLYLPREDVDDPATKARDKSLVQRLETSVIHWTRQIKEVVTHLDVASSTTAASGQDGRAPDDGPLGEIDFWAERARNLTSVRIQLEQPAVAGICAVLRESRSGYLEPFERLAEVVLNEAEAAEDSVKFLRALKDPGEALAKAKMSEIPGLLPDLLNAVRMIWTISRHYNTPRRIVGLLRKTSNAVIGRCVAQITLDDAWTGDAESVKRQLDEAVEACRAWDGIFRSVQAEVNRVSPPGRRWDFGPDSIDYVFAYVETFVQRCRDLRDVCDSQLQFAPRASTPVPTFGGTTGPDIQKGLRDIQTTYLGLVKRMRALPYSVLDVSMSTRWHDDYSTFCVGVKDLEMMFSNVIALAFGSSSSLMARMDLLAAFHSMAQRDSIRRAIEKEGGLLCTALIHEASRCSPNRAGYRSKPDPHVPPHAAEALWALSLKKRIDTPMARFRQIVPRLISADGGSNSGGDAPRSVIANHIDEVEETYAKVVEQIEVYVDKHHAAWMSTVHEGLRRGFESHLIKPRADLPDSGLLEVDFDPAILELFQEVLHWERMGREIPYGAMMINAGRERLRILHEQVLLVVGDYNRIVRALERPPGDVAGGRSSRASERRLFADRMKFLGRRVGPGLEKLTWASDKKKLEAYVYEARRHCRDVWAVVERWQAARKHIAMSCELIQSSILLDIERKRVYDHGDFLERQMGHMGRVKDLFARAISELQATVADARAIFADDSPEVHAEWRRFSAQWDDDVKTALVHTWKKSIQELLRALQGDTGSDATDVSPVFRVQVVLADGHTEIRPSVQELYDVIFQLRDEIVLVAKVLPRLKERRDGAARAGTIGGPTADRDTAAADGAVANDDVAAAGADLAPVASTSEPSQMSMFEYLAKKNEEDEHTLSQLRELGKVITHQIFAYVSRWESSYGRVWSRDKTRTLERYARQNQPLAHLVAQIDEYVRAQDEVMQEETTSSLAFLRFDCSPIKQAILAHCEEWITRYNRLLHEQAQASLHEQQTYLRSTTEALAAFPSTLDELSVAVRLHSKVAGNAERGVPAEKAVLYGRMGDLIDQYTELKKLPLPVPEDELEAVMGGGLEDEWRQFDRMLKTADAMLVRAKDSQRDRLINLVQQAVTDFTEFKARFDAAAPSQTDGYERADRTLDVAKAVAFLDSSTNELGRMREAAAGLKGGMDIFSVAEPPFAEAAAVEKDIAALRNLWDVVGQWQKSYNAWKDTPFRMVVVASMEETATRLSKTVVKLGRELKSWPVWARLRSTVDSFVKTMPLIVDLGNPAMRARHWRRLIDHVGESFDPESDDFRLEMMMTLGLHTHAEFIGELSGNASKELQIEEGIGAISTTWATLELDLASFKSTFKLTSTDDIFQALEDNIVSLSSMKGSRFFPVFKEDILRWEAVLTLVSDTVERASSVQRSWLYLESIFVGSEDIRRQLPVESNIFDEVNLAFQRTMREINRQRLCTTACTPERLAVFNALEERLDHIQKRLDHYLESKRRQFPRFYYLADADLLEILGQARDPAMVQRHLKKMFEGVATMQLLVPDANGKGGHAVTGFVAPDGEVLSLKNKLKLEGRPEEWLNDVETAMYSASKTHLLQVLEASRSTRREKWLRESVGQMIITAGQTVWTAECEKALADPSTSKKDLRQLKRKWISYLGKLTAVTRLPRLSKIDRNKTVALITIEVHARDSIERLYKAGATATTDFEWLSQLRFYWDREPPAGLGGPAGAAASGVTGGCVVKQVLSVFAYGYEYQGNNGRLVVTPLTDRCYVTLGAALFTGRGGNPLGPAGTGKTETVKDFGKALARYVMVFNCSDGVTSAMTAKMFAGLAQTGAWACFDEFNRITVEVLSVVASQIGTVMTALRAGLDVFSFEGQDLRLVSTCGVFVTMNPGYAGRAELPDNLKALLRPVSMMVPDFALISEIMMFSEGFAGAKGLAKKMVAIMELSRQQLSKQDHYDYGLRSFVIPLARAAGATRRADPEAPEEVVMFQTMVALIQPKLVYQDLPLFVALLSDLFPGVEAPPAEVGVLRAAIEADIRSQNLVPVPAFVNKVIEIFDCKLARHGNMIVGKTGAGKSSAWKCLQRTLSTLSAVHPDEEHYQKVHVHTINPLALSNDEIYGSFHPSSGDWQPGVLSHIMRECCEDVTPDQKWILFDGPVDTLWIESMNTTLDDNKLLTLLNGDRILMTPQTSILFEVEDLSQASPATVSRAGMIYLNSEDLGWRPFTQSWLADPVKARPSGFRDAMRGLLDKYLEPVLRARARGDLSTCVAVDPLNGVKTLTRLIDHFATPANGVDPAATPEVLIRSLELWFQFCLTWSLGADLTSEGRRAFDLVMREMDSRFPPADTVFEYALQPGRGDKDPEWVPWESRLSGFRPSAEVPLYRLMVPTVDTLRTSTIVRALLADGHHTLVTGEVGVGKTMIIKDVLAPKKGDENGPTVAMINFSAQTSSQSLQETIEGRLVRRSKGILGPDSGRRMVAFIDDLNMPQKSQFGFIPPLELLKLWCDNGFWYDRKRCTPTHIVDTQLLAAMAPPGGGRNAFSQRIQACFSLVNVTPPSDGQLGRIFTTLLSLQLGDFEDEVKAAVDQIAQASIKVYRAAVGHLLPTPSKSHYLFNTRDLSKIVQGVLRADNVTYDSRESILRLWCHETHRVIGDRMADPDDTMWLSKEVDATLQSVFGTSFQAIHAEQGGVMARYVSFLSDPIESKPTGPGAIAPKEQDDRPVYKPFVGEEGSAEIKNYLLNRLIEHGAEPGTIKMNLVLFEDAVGHVCRIHRVLEQPRGHVLLVGVGGSGRKSLARLAAYTADMACFSIELTRGYRHTDFREDLKRLCSKAGLDDQPTVFLFDETEIKYETFLEDVNNLLTSGEVPNLYPKEELAGLLSDLGPAAKAAGVPETAADIYGFFLDRVAKNLHVVLCLSPLGDTFRERCRMFPGLVNCTTIDWFTEWPGGALQEVAERLLEGVPEDVVDAETRKEVAATLVAVHKSVLEVSARMRDEIGRVNHVTPTNFIETVRGYLELLDEKRTGLLDKADKLRSGLNKLEETGVQVAEMQEVAKAKKAKVAKAKAECDNLLVQIVQDRRVADEQQRAIDADAAKISKEAAEADAMAAECKRDLELVLPVLEAAQAALEIKGLPQNIAELKNYTTPPRLAELALAGVLTVLRKPASWDNARKAMGDPGFLGSLTNFDKSRIDDALLKKMAKYVSNPEFTPERVATQSGAAAPLCQWVIAMEEYGQVNKRVAPKRHKMETAEAAVAKKKAALARALGQLEDVKAQVQGLENRYNESTAENEQLAADLAELEGKLERAERLVSGLAGEQVRWEATIKDCEGAASRLPGDVVLAAAFLSYAGPFPSEYRDAIVTKTWLPQVRHHKLPASRQFDFATFLADPSDARDWQIQGLPADSFSTENGVLVTRGKRWPLAIDPQGQASRWIRSMEAGLLDKSKLVVVQPAQADLVRQIERALQSGLPVLLQDVEEEIDPVLDSLLGKAYTGSAASGYSVRLGDREVDVSPDFRLYLTTKLPNPVYLPEISTKVTIVNFAVKEAGLEAQLLNLVVAEERPDLDELKNDLVVRVARGKRTQAELEDLILEKLGEATGSLLDNVELINTLDSSKTTWEEVKAMLKRAERTSAEIEVASQEYAGVAQRASLLYFVLNDLSKIDRMYQFSLDAYVELFRLSMQQAPKPTQVSERVRLLNDHHTYAVYKYTARALFERHKLLMSLQMCVRVLQTSPAAKFDDDDWRFFLRGVTVLDRSAQPPNPSPASRTTQGREGWITEQMWDHITELGNASNGFEGLVGSFDSMLVEWERWYRDPEPENQPLPGEWESRTNELQKMVIVRCLRPDRVMFASSNFVASSLGHRFIEPPVLDLAEIFNDSVASIPLVFVLSPGVDPSASLTQLAKNRDMEDNLFTVALGQGQEARAAALIAAGAANGHWVFLANCHLMTSWLPDLDAIIEAFSLPGSAPHPNFRLWLSSNPSDRFPISILQRSMKMTTEPPRGLKANLVRLYNGLTPEGFASCHNQVPYQRLLFALAFFHSVLLERRKFRTLGFNIPYDFNDTDFVVSDDLLRSYLDSYDEVPWDALRYLIAEANYGGRVTDELDRRVLNSYMNQFYREETMTVQHCKLSDLPQYYVPDAGTLGSVKDYLSTLPSVDLPEAFGQHPNADISYQREDSMALLDSLYSLQPKTATGGAGGRDDAGARVLALAANLLVQCPAFLPESKVGAGAGGDDADNDDGGSNELSALDVVLRQETQRYNVLLARVRADCHAVQKGIRGLVVMSSELDAVSEALAAGKVPGPWLRAYPSLKGLGAWMRDLDQRIDQLRRWAEQGRPLITWMSGLTYPTAFLTAVLQTTARKNSIPIDSLTFECSVLSGYEDKDITAQPKEGVYVRGAFLEGAGWDADRGCLCEPDRMRLVQPMPIIHFKPVEGRKKGGRGTYACPLYLYPIRTGTRERPSLVTHVDLRPGPVDPDHWIKRGTALLLSLAT